MLAHQRLLSSCQRKQAFGASLRLLLNRDFQRVFSNGYSQACKTMVAWVTQGESLVSRLGVVASKRTFPRAVDRNRAKRMIREAFRKERLKWDMKVDVVVVARRRLLMSDADRVRHDLSDLVQGIAKRHKQHQEKVKR